MKTELQLFLKQNIWTSRVHSKDMQDLFKTIYLKSRHCSVVMLVIIVPYHSKCI